MRIYYPALLEDIRADRLAPGRCHAVTVQLRQLMPEADTEDLEYLAFEAAAASALELAAARPGALPLRAVIAADTDAAEADAEATGPSTLAEPLWAASSTELTAALPWTEAVSIHIDDPASLELMRSAAGGQEPAIVEALGADLLWYDIAERADLIDLLAAVTGGQD